MSIDLTVKKRVEVESRNVLKVLSSKRGKRVPDSRQYVEVTNHL